MIDLVKRFFGKSTEDGAEVQRKKSSLDIHVATCALFLEMSKIDGEFSESEKEHIMLILKKDYGLSDEHATALLQASDEELKGSIDLWQFTNLINQNYSVEDKLQIIETIWRIAYTDGKLDEHEDYLLHKLAKLLRLSHKQLIEAKLRAKEPVANH
jgi:uncharacterized tellurite resistance protein B-like protein